MNKNSDAESGAFIGRQLAALLEKDDTQTAFRRLEQECGPEYQPAIEQLRRRFNANQADAIRHPTDLLARFSNNANFDGRAFFRGYMKFYDEWMVVLQTFWAGTAGLVNYLATMSALALVVIVIFIVYVMPAFEDMFTSFGGDLPLFTKVVFSLNGGWHLLAALILVVLTLIGVFFVRSMRRRFTDLRPLPRLPDEVPFVGRLSGVYNYVLFLNLAGLLRDAGVDMRDAVNTAADYVKQSETMSHDKLTEPPNDDDVLTPIRHLKIAARLGTLQQEIAAQRNAQVGTLAKQLVLVRESFGITFKTLMYVLLGTIIVAMYLPIFKMGSIV